MSRLRMASSPPPDLCLHPQHLTISLAGRARSLSATAFEAFAQTVEFAAWYGTPTGAFNDDLSLVFSGGQARLAGWNEHPAEARGVFVGDNAFHVNDSESGSTGFKREFRDRSNQVQHTSFALSVVSRYPTLGLGRLQSRERPIPGTSNADMRLNAAIHDVAIEVLTSPYASSAVLVPRSPKQLGNRFRTMIGDPSQTAPWTGPEEGIAVSSAD